jgi:hypothetical protein
VTCASAIFWTTGRLAGRRFISRISGPREHLRQKTLDDAAKAKVDRTQFGLDQTQTKR